MFDKRRPSYNYDIGGLSGNAANLAYEMFAAPRKTPEEIAIDLDTKRAGRDMAMAQAVAAEKSLYQPDLYAEQLGQMIAAAEQNGGQLDNPEMAAWAARSGNLGGLFELNRGFEAIMGKIDDEERINNQVAVSGTIDPTQSVSANDRAGTRAWLTRKAVKEQASRAANSPLSETQWIAKKREEEWEDMNPRERRVALNLRSKPSLSQQVGPDGQTGYIDTNAHDPEFQATRTTQGTADGGVAMVPYASSPIATKSTLPAAVQSNAAFAERRGLSPDQGARKAELLNILHKSGGTWPSFEMEEEFNRYEAIEQAHANGLTVNELQLLRGLEAIMQGDNARELTPEENEQYMKLAIKSRSHRMGLTVSGAAQPAPSYAAPANARILE